MLCDEEIITHMETILLSTFKIRMHMGIAWHDAFAANSNRQRLLQEHIMHIKESN